uniref:Uncharacterized protein n=1 Tax=Amphimedon queenslandica TaxID=400682 RepID=A0A1X7VTG3_AMPQE
VVLVDVLLLQTVVAGVFLSIFSLIPLG